MEKRSIYCATGVALLTLFFLPQAAIAGADKAADKTTATDNTPAKRELLMQQKTGETKPGAAGTVGKQGEAGTGGSMEVRDWTAIDTNKDHSIQPEEMEKYLTDSWATQKKAVQKAK